MVLLAAPDPAHLRKLPFAWRKVSMSYRLQIAIALISCMLLSGTATAAGAGDFARPGPYIGVGFGAGWDFLEDAIEGVIPELQVGTGWSANARVGYRVTSWFAAEALYEGIYDLDMKFNDLKFAETSLHSILGNFKFILPTWRMHPYIGLGFGTQYGTFKDVAGILNTSRWDFVFRPSLGLDSYVTESWVINFEIAPSIRFADYGNIPSETTDNVSLTFSGGLQYRF
jgi:hypothetical protein